MDSSNSLEKEIGKVDTVHSVAVARAYDVRGDRRRLLRDIWLVGLSILLAAIIIRIGIVDQLLSASQELYVLGAFIAGIFFTSMLTVTPASVVLAEISQHIPILVVASVGAAGAVVGDLFLFFLIRDGISDDVASLLSNSQKTKIKHIFSKRLFRWLTPFVGAMIIASPLPDELGLAMMGLSKMKLRVFIPISYVMNFLGVILVGLIAGII